MILTYRFVESGGYDCMSDAFYIEDQTRPEYDRRIATIDLRDFIDRIIERHEPEARARAEQVTRQLVNRFNLHDELVTACEAVECEISGSDVLFDPQEEGEQERLDRAHQALYKVTTILRKVNNP